MMEKIFRLKNRSVRFKEKNTITTAWYGYQDKIISFLSKDLPNKNFNLDDLIELFIQLSSLGYDLFKSLPKDDGIKPGDLNKLRMFSPTIKIEILVDALTQSLAQDRYIILEMLEFLTFTGNSKKGPRADLWRTPLIKLNESEFILILESIMHPIGIRY